MRISHINVSIHHAYVNKRGAHELPCEHGLQNRSGATHPYAYRFVAQAVVLDNVSSGLVKCRGCGGTVAVVVKFSSLVRNCTDYYT